MHPETRESDPVIVNDPLESGNRQPPSQATGTTPAFGYGPFGDQPAADAKKSEDKKP